MNKIEVKIFLTENKTFSEFLRFLPALPEDRQRKIASLIRDEDKFLSLAAGLLIKRELPDDAVIKTDENGKPYVLNYPDIHFSVSHTKGAAAFVRSNSPVGIDIEKNAPFSDTDKIAKRYFTTPEYDFCRGDSARFFEIWTKKEAYIKMTGKGLRESLNSFSVLSDPRILTLTQDDFCVSVCSESCINNQLIIENIFFN
jgi:4'-phosphopantetheinyl transferase